MRRWPLLFFGNDEKLMWKNASSRTGNEAFFYYDLAEGHIHSTPLTILFLIEPFPYSSCYSNDL